ncbi:hypothetical protein BC938DRAFT_476323 [Jimgerdemannia flammicorona]|uniref:Uncharacterized protein n=1 Tax=Jimgerdemannia flammicorona TaxID=994334 RepID=A0A433QQQ0_9FUNG|nr:hypothetical protein BC938DRAFT_476323 [Jimgerdemannia flammicorona]
MKANISGPHLNTEVAFYPTHSEPAQWEETTYRATMINEPCDIAHLGRINHRIIIHSEQVRAPDAGSLVPLLAVVGHLLPNDLAHVLDDHVVGVDAFLGE